MEHIFAYSAAALGYIWCAVHFFLGGKEISKPLREDRTLPEAVRVTMWMCWHMVSVTLFIMPSLILVGALADLPGMLWSGIALAFGLFVAGIASALVLRVSFGLLFQGWLFLPVAVLGVLAL